MADQLPAPPVPADADLTDFKFMPLEVARLRRSKAWLICKRRPEVAFYMLNLWAASWHERPAGSLEDDDDVLADAAMCPPERWAKVRADAMRGWAKHSDGRLYHPVVAEKVWESWLGKLVARWAKECDRIRKENHRRKENNLPSLDFPPKPERKSESIPPERPPPSAGIPAEKPLKGQGRDRETEGKGERTQDAAASDAAAPAIAVPLETQPPAGDGLDLLPGLDRTREAATAAADDDLAIPGFLKRTSDARVEEDAAFAAFQETARRLGWPNPPMFLDSGRRPLLRARLGECGGLLGWTDALKAAETADFLREPDGSWKWWFKFNWLIDQSNFVKLMEGNYAQRHRNDGKQSGLDTTLEALAAWGREGTG